MRQQNPVQLLHRQAQFGRLIGRPRADINEEKLVTDKHRDARLRRAARARTPHRRGRAAKYDIYIVAAKAGLRGRQAVRQSLFDQAVLHAGMIGDERRACE